MRGIENKLQWVIQHLPTVCDKLNLVASIHNRKLTASIIKEIREKDVKIKQLSDRVVELENTVKIIMDKLREISPHEVDEVALTAAVLHACEASGARLVFAGVHVTASNPVMAWAMRTLYGGLLPKYRGKIAIGRMVETSATRPVVLGVSNFMQNDEVLIDVIRAGEFVHPCHPGGLNRVDLRDLGEIAANVLLDKDVPAGAYPVVGPRSLTGRECAQVWSEALGVPVSYAGDDDAALEAALTSHL